MQVENTNKLKELRNKIKEIRAVTEVLKDNEVQLNNLRFTSKSMSRNIDRLRSQLLTIKWKVEVEKIRIGKQ